MPSQGEESKGINRMGHQRALTPGPTHCWGDFGNTSGDSTAWRVKRVCNTPPAKQRAGGLT